MLVQLLPLVEFNTLCPADNAKSLQRKLSRVVDIYVKSFVTDIKLEK
jgi:hypothetical protein